MAKFLEPAGPDRFTAAEWFMAEVHFLRDTTHGNSAMTLGGGRVGLPFNRRFAASTLSAMTPRVPTPETTLRTRIRGRRSSGSEASSIPSDTLAGRAACLQAQVAGSSPAAFAGVRVALVPTTFAMQLTAEATGAPPDSAGSMAVRVPLVNNNLPV